MTSFDSYAVVARGTEEFARNELKTRWNTDSESAREVIFFKAPSISILSEYAYKTQIANKVYLLLSRITSTELQAIKDAIKEINIDSFIQKKSSVKIECSGLARENAAQIIEEIAPLLIKKHTVNLETPDAIIGFHQTQTETFLGLDLVGFDKSKRHYKVFTSSATIKGTIAASLLEFSDFAPSDHILDPFCGAGTIPIEAALRCTNTSPDYFRKDAFLLHKIPLFANMNLGSFDSKSKDKPSITGSDHQLRHVKAAQKNAKIAGVDGVLTLTRIDLDWLDTKFDEGKVHKIITQPPDWRKEADQKQVAKLFKEFFYQLDYVLAKNGTVGMICQKTEVVKEQAATAKYTLEKECTVWQGQEQFTMILFKKNK